MVGRAEPGRVIAGRYRLQEVIGSGGFGRVWRARDGVLGVDVAVKEVWLPELSSDTEAATGTSPFRRETRTATLNALCVHAPAPPGPPGPLTALITALLDKDPAQRPTAAQALRTLDDHRAHRTKPMTAPRAPAGRKVRRGPEPDRPRRADRRAPAERREDDGRLDVPPLLAGVFFVLLGVALSVAVVALSASLAREHPGLGEVLAIGAFAGLTVGFGSVGVLRGWRLPDGRAGRGGVAIGVAWMVMLTATVWPRVH
ncbi:hypothetical protein SAZ_38980 [Streptomyces noursei ZPM]|uniref:Serine/threonine protein kinase n=1 Tax=Streptomyces noursei TaxID=1971 RepID=A0A401RDM2_STRNR|nr:hypothetical protein SAZ_38980 [Streptomyces noursei ZPM]EPY92966.1 hypothetical protein K530_50520 [Streptomyces noursei CCRC 11814]GCB95688.1 serine/threonine protein kinase [Streptomyces noursei]